MFFFLPSLFFSVEVERLGEWKYFTCQRSSKQHLGWAYPSILLGEVSLEVGVAGEVDG